MESDRRATGQMPFQRQLRAIGPGKQVAELATIAEITSCVSRIASNYIYSLDISSSVKHTHTANVWNIIHEL